MAILETIATIAAIAGNLFGGGSDDSAQIKAHDDALDEQLKSALAKTQALMNEVYPENIKSQKYNEITNTSFSFWNSKNFNQASQRIVNAYNDAVRYGTENKSIVKETMSIGGTEIPSWLIFGGLGLSAFFLLKK